MINKKRKSFNRGTKAKYKTMEYYKAQGYTCEYSEIFRKYGSIVIKHDIFGADIMATRLLPTEEFILINSVFGKCNISTHKKNMLSYPIPSFIKRVIAVWDYKAGSKRFWIKEPVIIGIEDSEISLCSNCLNDNTEGNCYACKVTFGIHKDKKGVDNVIECNNYNPKIKE